MSDTDLIGVQLRLETYLIEEIEKYIPDEYGAFNIWMLEAVQDFLQQPVRDNLETPIIFRLSERSEKVARNIRCPPSLIDDIDDRIYNMNKEYNLTITRTQWIIAALRSQIEVERAKAKRLASTESRRQAKAAKRKKAKVAKRKQMKASKRKRRMQ